MKNSSNFQWYIILIINGIRWPNSVRNIHLNGRNLMASYQNIQEKKTEEEKKYRLECCEKSEIISVTGDVWYSDDTSVYTMGDILSNLSYDLPICIHNLKLNIHFAILWIFPFQFEFIVWHETELELPHEKRKKKKNKKQTRKRYLYLTISSVCITGIASTAIFILPWFIWIRYECTVTIKKRHRQNWAF